MIPVVAKSQGKAEHSAKPVTWMDLEMAMLDEAHQTKTNAT